MLVTTVLLLILRRSKRLVALKAEPILLFFHLFFFPAILLFFLPILLDICSLSSYFSTDKRFFLVYLQLLSMYDCYIRVIHNMVTALLEYFDLSQLVGIMLT